MKQQKQSPSAYLPTGCNSGAGHQSCNSFNSISFFSDMRSWESTDTQQSRNTPHIQLQILSVSLRFQTGSWPTSETYTVLFRMVSRTLSILVPRSLCRELKKMRHLRYICQTASVTPKTKELCSDLVPIKSHFCPMLYICNAVRCVLLWAGQKWVNDELQESMSKF